MLHRNVILKPLISEKSMGLTKGNFYSFLVDRDADKNMIRKVVEEKFDVNVLQVKTINIKGKIKQQRTRKGHFQTSSFRKAVIQLKKGQKIALFESETESTEGSGGIESEPVKEKKSLLRGTKVKIEKIGTKKEDEEKKEEKKG